MPSQDKIRKVYSGQSRRVFVGLSGGVDSSVSAALLKEAGFDVTGVFIKVWRPEFMECDNTRDRADSMRAASELGIKWRELNLEKEYKKYVVDYMIAEYSRGRVPNPDVMCNRFVKFGRFFDFAVKNGADFVATGHYAQLVKSKKAQEHKKKNFPISHLQLSTSRDSAKDQTYFLWDIPKKTLPRLLFPVGGYLKTDIRRLAKTFGLSAASKKDSQGLCFVGKIELKDFMERFVEVKRGVVLNDNGKEIGYHPGALIFTDGQRHGFTITEKTANDKPFYVVSKDMEKNTITVGSRENIKHEIKQIQAENANWLTELPVAGLKIKARLRHGGELLPATIQSVTAESFIVRLKKPVGFAPKGQSIVLYERNVCLGGGVIG